MATIPGNLPLQNCTLSQTGGTRSHANVFNAPAAALCLMSRETRFNAALRPSTQHRERRQPCDCPHRTMWCRLGDAQNVAARPLGRLAALIASSAALAMFEQGATICGSLGNFDAVSNTGLDGCGFERDLEGVLANTLAGTTRAGRLMQHSRAVGQGEPQQIAAGRRRGNQHDLTAAYFSRLRQLCSMRRPDRLPRPHGATHP